MKIFDGLQTLKEEDHRRALYAVLVFIMLAILFFLLVSLEEPDPPIQEEIVEVYMPDIEVEMGSPEEGGNDASTPEQEVFESAQDNAVQEESPVFVDQGESQSDGEDSEDSDIDEGLSYNPGGEGDGEGTGFGEEDGVGSDGIGNVPGDGEYNPDRKVIKDPAFNSNVQEEGKIALDIWVDADGKIYKTKIKESKSTSGSAYLIKLARKAAKTMKYDPKPGAGIEYVGYKIFSFTKV